MKPDGQREKPPLFRDAYHEEVDHYPVEIPEIISGADYYFQTESGLRYQVLFAKKKDSYLEHILNFSVLSEDFEDEYSETNRGEIYRVISTVVEIIRIFHANHLYSNSYEFSGEFKEGNEERESSIRTLLYYRKAEKIIHHSWKITRQGNKVIVSRKTL
ncbi:MAG: hypothetical protein GY790_15835 [Bacteroidetes bacterium]|nr:hypothetical protein [Bacteroidota bacterium]